MASSVRGENHAKTLQTCEKREKHNISKVKVQSPVQSPVQCLQYAGNRSSGFYAEVMRICKLIDKEWLRMAFFELYYKRNKQPFPVFLHSFCKIIV